MGEGVSFERYMLKKKKKKKKQAEVVRILMGQVWPNAQAQFSIYHIKVRYLCEETVNARKAWLVW